MNIFASAAGPSNGKSSNDITDKSGVGVIHFTDTFKDAKRFESEFAKLWPTLDRKKVRACKLLSYESMTGNQRRLVLCSSCSSSHL